MRLIPNKSSKKLIDLNSVAVLTVSILFFIVNTSAFSSEDTLSHAVVLSPQYTNYAEKGQYENEHFFSEVPQWHYYDMFGNKLLDGFYMYGMSKHGQKVKRGDESFKLHEMDEIALHPLLLRWLNGLLQVGDIQDNGGVLALIGERIRSQFTPFSFKQTLFAGARFDVFVKNVSFTFLTNRISHTGDYGPIVELATQQPISDWLTGIHGMYKGGELFDIGVTYANIHHEDIIEFKNPYFHGIDFDTLNANTPTGLSLYGINGNVNSAKIKAYGEYLLSQEFHDGKAKQKGGNVIALNGKWDAFEKLSLGGEIYSIGSRFQTNFNCPVHKLGDGVMANPAYGSMGKYQYSLVEDNDDNDEFPENGRSRYALYTKSLQQGDPDGVLPLDYDKDKNGVWDYEEDFLNYDANPPESEILFDRNSNGVPDEIENDPYPDYPYVPSYYLPGQRYYRYNKLTNQWEYKSADSMTHKGLAGLHLYGRYKILQDLELTVGGIFDRSQEKTFQMTYENGIPVREEFAYENALNLYLLAHYKKSIDRDKYLMLDNFFRIVKDNIPNHTQDFTVVEISPGENFVTYNIIPDNLDYRNMFGDAVRAEFTIFRNRGLNFTTAGKYEFQKRFPLLKYNYTDKTISTFVFLNNLSYIISVPVGDDIPLLKDLFIIPKIKNIWNVKSYGPKDSIPDPAMEAKYKGSNVTNMLALVVEWKLSDKSAVTLGGQIKRFDDLLNSRENYWEPCYRFQYMIKDRYSGMAVALVTGFNHYVYKFDNKHIDHNPLNNPHRVTNNINNHEFFIKVYCGM